MITVKKEEKMTQTDSSFDDCIDACHRAQDRNNNLRSYGEQLRRTIEEHNIRADASSITKRDTLHHFRGNPELVKYVIGIEGLRELAEGEALVPNITVLKATNSLLARSPSTRRM